MSNNNSSAGTVADSDMQPIVTTSASIAASPLLAAVYDQWNNKWVYEGTYEQCSKYIDAYNVYGYNYSKLRLKKDGKNGG